LQDYCGIRIYLISSILYSGDLGLQNKILPFELPIFFYQSIKMIAVIAWAKAAVWVVIFAMEAALAACGSGQITGVLESALSRGTRHI
jgi:hypothetical protein